MADASPACERTLAIKVAVALISGIAAFVHGRASTRRLLAASGAFSGLAAVGAVFLGVALRGG